MTDSEPGRTIRSLEKMDKLIKIIEKNGGARLSQLAEESGLAKSTVHGYVSTLESKGYLVKEGDQYQLGLLFLHLGSVSKYRKPIYRLADTMTQELSSRTDFSADFIVEQNNRLISVSCYQSGNHSSIGVYFSYHASATGKAILMEYSEDEIREKINLKEQQAKSRQIAFTETEIPFDSRIMNTENTITSIDDLIEDLERSRERGYTVSNKEIHEALRSIGTPIKDPSGATVGALSVAGASYRFTEEAIKSDISQTLLEIRNEFEDKISSTIEYQY